MYSPHKWDQGGENGDSTSTQSGWEKSRCSSSSVVPVSIFITISSLYQCSRTYKKVRVLFCLTGIRLPPMHGGAGEPLLQHSTQTAWGQHRLIVIKFINWVFPHCWLPPSWLKPFFVFRLGNWSKGTSMEYDRHSSGAYTREWISIDVFTFKVLLNSAPAGAT